MTEGSFSLARRLAVVLSAALLVACSDESTAPLETQTDGALAAQTFTQLADSVSRTGGDADVGSAYSNIAGVLRMGGRVTAIVLTVDGTPTTFLAAALTHETTYNNCPPGAQCFVPPETHVMHHLIAWEKDNPKRIVQLSSASNDDEIGAVTDPYALAIYRSMASLIYLDGAGGTYIGTSGTQKFDVTKSATPCPSVADSSGKLSRSGSTGTCTLADHAVTFSGTLETSPILIANNSAAGTHTIAMSTQKVAGTYRQITIVPCDSSCYKPDSGSYKPDSGSTPPTPPVIVRPSNELPASLSATVDSVVTLTFTVKNPSGNAIKVAYASGQKYDFVVTDSLTGRDAWRWSADKGFTQALVDETVPAGGALVFTEKWKPAKKGVYLAHGLLVSTSHRAEAYAAVVVP